MNVLPFEKQVQVVSALCEGASIRATERLTGIHRDTIMRLGLRVGNGCAIVHDATMRDLHVARLELDEAWSFVGKKQKNTTPEDVAFKGDQYVFIALAATAKAIVSYRIGKRNEAVMVRGARPMSWSSHGGAAAGCKAAVSTGAPWPCW